METKGKILWVDDEIEMLRSHIMFLEERGYKVKCVTNGEDAIILSREEKFDIIFLDEMMPGKDGLNTLIEVKNYNPFVPIVMITKSEEEGLIDEAIGREINDFLTKPVNPSQILSVCKRILESRKIKEEKLSKDYVSDFKNIDLRLSEQLDYNDWIEIYSKLSEWEIDFDKHPDTGFEQTLIEQIKDCNTEFCKYIEKNYSDWINSENRTCLSIDLVKRYVIPELVNNNKVFFLIFDCLRNDQWLALEPYFHEFFDIAKEYYYSILPTATPYSRNSIFSGLHTIEIERNHSDLWEKGFEDDSSRNRYERQFLETLLSRENINLKQKLKYIKILDIEESKNVERNIDSLATFPLVSIVVNFVDILSHKRSESELLKEIAPNESAYRSLICSWFEHSSIFHILKKLSTHDVTIILTSDHGSIRCLRPAMVLGDRETSTNLRYKFGRNLKCNNKQSILIKKPEDYMLPSRGINCQYLIAKEDFYLIYPTNYNKYVNLYKDCFQHGGISMQEMILPIIKLKGKRI
ncbi:MAG: response regulator [Candidatus Helarchaeota archaeon]|nr:response regulator [Candidatus Helarchaeota archaeon]